MGAKSKTTKMAKAKKAKAETEPVPLDTEQADTITHAERASRRAKWLKDVQAGMTVGDIALRDGVSPNTVTNFLKSLSPDVKRYRGTHRTLLMVAALCDSSKTYADIANEFGVSIQRVGQICVAAIAAKIPGVVERSRRFNPPSESN